MPRNPGVYPCAFCPPLANIRGSALRAVHKAYYYLPSACCLLLLLLTQHTALITVRAQSATATLTGTVTDQNGALVAGANIAVISTAQGFQRTATTNDAGTFVIPLLPAGIYTVKADHKGFAPAEVRNVVLNVNANVKLPISMKIGNLVDQQVDVNYNPSLIDQRPSVGGKVDSRLVTLPQNGRTWQNLITLLPGVQFTKATGTEQGQFSVNGQRANTNSFYVDGVSANIGVPTNASPGQSAGGSLPGLSAAGGTNNLVSIDALQEFEVETSSYAPEFGRTPGAQVIIATRSGTNQFHGTLFEYFRNDVLDANDWFANSRRQGKAPLRQNDFGGVLGGPILLPRFGEGGRQPWYNGRDRTFFFFSYEGLRLRQPLFAITEVPTLASRQAAPAGIQPFLNAFPRPTGPPKATNFAEFAAGFSNPASFDATSLRIDHHVNNKVSLFARYNISPSESIQRGGFNSLNNLDHLQMETQTLTGGATLLLSPSAVAELRANYSHNSATRTFSLDSFGGATVPSDSILFPSFASSTDSNMTFSLGAILNRRFIVGRNLNNLQRQLNLVNSLAVVTGSHELKFGLDFRRLSPSLGPRVYGQTVNIAGINGALLGRATTVNVQSQLGPVVPIYLNFSVYAQDIWKVNRRLSLTYGLRHEINPPPSELNDRSPATLLQIADPKSFALAPAGEPLWNTTYNNFAPRVGVAFQLSQRPGRETVLRGGYGLFFDLGSGVGGHAFLASFPYSGVRTLRNVTFPLVSASDAVAPPIGTLPITQLFAFDRDLKLPYSHQWNAAIEQSLGKNQTVSASYVAALGRRLLRQEQFGGATLSGNPLFSASSLVFVTSNAATSDYHSFQLRFQRRLTSNIQALSHYTWAKSIDTASNDSSQFGPSLAADPNRDRAASDFDVRHSFNAAITYGLPTPKIGKVGAAIFGHWSIDTIVAIRSATPVDVTVFRDVGFGGLFLRPDLIQGVPLYIDDPNVGGGRRFNPAAFREPTQLRQGTLGRNVLRGFSLVQTDLGVTRRFKVTEALNLEFKAEFFNIFNHPNFGDPEGNLAFFGDPTPGFGMSFRMFGKGLGTGGTLGGLNPLYQVGGPRSVQMSLRLRF